MLETFTVDTFSGRTGERFKLDLEGHEPLELELVEVTELGAPGAERRTQFSIVFGGPAEPLLPQRIYRVEHPEIGAFDIFLVPIAPGTYEAVFT